MTIKETLNLLLIYFLSHGATLFFSMPNFMMTFTFIVGVKKL